MKEMWKLLNQTWIEQCSMCCSLPCGDAVCREDMASEGGCHGAEFADRFSSALAAEKKAREEDKLRIAQLEEALREIQQSHRDQEGHRRGKYRKTLDICEETLTSTPSALSEVLRAERKVVDAAMEWLEKHCPNGYPTGVRCSICTAAHELKSLQKYEEDK